MGITLVKSNLLTVAIGATEVEEVDLGLGIEEAARILGVVLVLRLTPAVASGLLTAVYSFDPEDVAVAGADDEQFVGSEVAVDIVGAAYAAVTTRVNYFNFVGLNLITTRNLAFIATSVTTAGIAYGRVYYEKYKPAATELIQLIAQRR